MQLEVCSIFLAINTVYCANVLGLFPISAKSAFVASEAIMKGLAAKGHNVTVLSCFPQKTPIENYTDISIGHLRELFNSSVRLDNFELPLRFTYLTQIFLNQIEEMDLILKSNEIHSLLASNVSYDVVFHEMFVDNIFLMLARKFKAPIIAVAPSYIFPWAADRFAIPNNPSYIPVVSNSFSGKMSFYERFLNSISYLKINYMYWNILVPKSYEVYKRNFIEELPTVSEAGKNVSMYFVNSHFSIYGARPYPPQVVDIGGIHLQPTEMLPKELSQWIDNSPDGIIYFSFGSMLKGSSLPREKIESFVKAFKGRLQRVLWKFEDEHVIEMPKNVKAMKWLPQKDILAHPKTRLFITHGGLMGVMEAVSNGVPIIGIPTNMDQANNVASLVDLGVGIHIDYNNITDSALDYAMNEVLTDNKYRNNAKLLSSRFLDRPMSPLDTAVYWTEYVIQHRGAPHLQSAAVHLTWYQYYLLDVIAIIIGFTLLFMLVVYYTIRCFLRLCFVKPFGKLKNN